MDSEKFIKSGRAILQLLATHHDNIADLNVMPILTPGFLTDLIPCKCSFVMFTI